jgi:FixJ family two-component response regulator/signal transduction histidine kinase
VTIEWFNDLPFSEMLKRAAAMPSKSAILWILLSEDAAGIPYSQDSALEAMREVSAVPIFGTGDFEIGRGIVGGPLIQTRALGREAAEVALRIFQGEKPAAIDPRYVTLGVPIYDWRELRRWNISETRLPPGSVVHFREPTIWEQYRWHVASVIGVLLAQAAIIALLVLEHRRRRIAEQELRRRLLEVIHLNRTALTGALSGAVAHELSQPLGAIQSYADAASRNLKADPPNIQRVEQILESIRQDDKRAADIISHLRGLLKKTDATELQEFDLNDVIRDALRIAGPQALKQGIELTANHAMGPLPVRGDRIQLQQAILNLVINGIDAVQSRASGPGKISIQTTMVGDSQTEVSVADSGTGIPVGKLNEVFETFYTTKRHGTGLGLPIARTIVETYGGKIWAENRAGGGAVFRFTTVVQGQRDMNKSAPVVHVVDDDASFRSAIGELLGISGYRVFLYESATQLLATPPTGEPACILLDVQMAGLSGPQLQDRLAELGLRLPIVFITGHGDIPTTVKTIKAGAEDFLTKPVVEEKLLAAIERALIHYEKVQAQENQISSFRSLFAELTPREREVFALLVRGKLHKQIAFDLGITVRTVKLHRYQMTKKLKVRSLAELTVIAERLGLLSESAKENEASAHTGKAAASANDSLF